MRGEGDVRCSPCFAHDALEKVPNASLAEASAREGDGVISVTEGKLGVCAVEQGKIASKSDDIG